MRALSLTVVCLCVSCASAPPRRADTGFDPELYEICDDAPPDPGPACRKSEEGLWTSGRAPSSALRFGWRAFEDGSYEEAVRTLTQTAMYAGSDDACGRLQARWLRGRAEAKLGLYDEALRDYARVIVDGRGTPFMTEAPKRLDELEGKAPAAAIAPCRAAIAR